jgi:hypothetical protein
LCSGKSLLANNSLQMFQMNARLLGTTIGCVGIRNNKRLVFFSDAANHAAKLQDHVTSGETALSPLVYRYRPSFLTPENDWPIRHDNDENVQERHVVSNGFAADDPPETCT